MERGLLGKVVEAERQIQERIDSEKKRWEEELQKVRREAEEKIRQEEASLSEQCEKSVREAEKSAEERASAILDAAAVKAAKLKDLNDEVLKQIVMKYIHRLLPGACHDRPHVQG